jgi:hypothetical protein
MGSPQKNANVDWLRVRLMTQTTHRSFLADTAFKMSQTAIKLGIPVLHP